MDFCGGSDGVLDVTDTRVPHLTEFQCGAGVCVNDDDEGVYLVHRNHNLLERPMKTALDSIQQTLDDLPADSFSTPNRLHRHNSVSGLTVIDDTPTSSYHGGYNATPSPNLLNPLTNDWRRVCEVGKEKNVDKQLMCPILDGHCTSPSFEVLMNRMQRGFIVRLVSAPSSCLVGEPSVRLYANKDRTRLCLASINSSDMRKEKNEAVEYGIELPVSEILRIEVGGKTNPKKSFTLVFEKDANKFQFYDFEISSAIDREVLVSTIMLLLEERRKSLNDAWIDGGVDQPIPCSPSLERPADRLVSGENDLVETSYLLPRKRSQRIYMHHSCDVTTNSIIHEEEICHGNSRNGMCSIQARRELATGSLSQQGSSDVHERDLQLDVKPSASSNHLGLNTVNSSNVAPSAWCVSDTCTITLNDLADTCTGIFAMKHPEWNCDIQGVREQSIAVEEFIATALGAPNTVYSYLRDGNIWNAIDANSKDPKDATELRNRASLFNAQAARLRSLRNEMTFAAALKQSKQRMQFVQTVRSFDETSIRNKGRAKTRAATRAAKLFHSSDLLKSVVKRMSMHDTNGESKDEGDEILYYDSDPEFSRLSNTGVDPRKVGATRKDYTRYHENEEFEQSKVTFDKIATTRDISRKMDEETIADIVQTMNNERLMLMWHPNHTEHNPNRSPVCVKVWIEAGIYLNDGTFLMPKITWGEHGKVKEPIRKLELLDICRIRALRTIDRKQHPFAIARKSFYIETQQEIIVFQAQSSDERDRIVYGLKLVVARLASFLMLRDVRAAEEFFGSLNNNVPGESPAWTKE